MLLVASTIFCDTLKKTDRQTDRVFASSGSGHTASNTITKHHRWRLKYVTGRRGVSEQALLASEIDQNLLGCFTIIKDFSPVWWLITSICPPYTAVLWTTSAPILKQGCSSMSSF